MPEEGSSHPERMFLARTKTPQIHEVTTRALKDESLGRCAIPDNIDLQIEVPDNLLLLRLDPLPDMKCLVLLATAGDKAEWNSRKSSQGHQAIPLPSEEAVHQVPMVSNLIIQSGIPLGKIIWRPDPELLLDMEQKTYNVFHVPEALGSPYIPAQEEFVTPCNIRSVLGFGGLLPSGEMFADIMFFKVPISREVANLFKALSLSVKMAVLPFDGAVFS